MFFEERICISENLRLLGSVQLFLCLHETWKRKFIIRDGIIQNVSIRTDCIIDPDEFFWLGSSGAFDKNDVYSTNSFMTYDSMRTFFKNDEKAYAFCDTESLKYFVNTTDRQRKIEVMLDSAEIKETVCIIDRLSFI